MKRVMIATLLTAATAAVLGCDVTNTPAPEKVKEIGAQLAYFQDGRTGLCFGAIQSATYGDYAVTSIASVPCDKMPK